MPKRNRHSQRFFLSLVALALAGLAAFGRRRRPAVAETAAAVARPPMLEPVPESSPPPMPRPRPAARIGVAATFTVLFFAGAAFTAGAGDQLAVLVEGEPAVAVEAAPAALALDAPADEPTPVEEPAVTEEAPVVEEPPVSETPVVEEVQAAEEVQVAQTPAVEAAPVVEEAAVAEEPAAADVAQVEPAARAEKPAPQPAARTAAPAPRGATATRSWVSKRAQLPPARPAEIERTGETHGEPTIWLNRALPDPTPPSARLTREFARSLVRVSRSRGADWASVLGLLRAQGSRGPDPASSVELARLAARLRGDGWRGSLALSGRTSFADRAEALAAYHRAVGVESLVTGLEASKSRLVERLLADPRVTIYPGGRDDLAAGRIDVRVVVLISYLAERHGSLTVSSLFSGHRRFARPGVVSAHMFGQAVDIAAVGGASIAGNQQPGGLTESAVRSILLLPAELQPQQVISLLGLGGPSFPLADHGDHIHVGY